MIVATSSYLRFVHGWDAQSALFGASPGALAQVMTLAAEYRADLRAIAIVQTMRVVALTIGIPAGLALFGLTAPGGGLMARFGAAGPPSIAELAILVVVSTVDGARGLRLRLPGGLMFGAMIGSAILHGGGFIHADPAVVGGVRGGDRHRRGHRLALCQHRSAARCCAFSARRWARSRWRWRSRPLSVLVLTTLLSVRVADAVVAFAPGAQDTMMVLALALHLDPVFVGAHATVALPAGVAAGAVPGAPHAQGGCRNGRERAHPPGATRPGSRIEALELFRRERALL